MAINVLSPINYHQFELQNPRLHFLTTGTYPGTPVEGQICYTSDDHLPKVWNGSAWVSMVSTGSTFAAPAFVLGTAAAAGVAATGVRSDATIALFDATNPAASAVGDAAAVGAAAYAARRDHVHAREAFATPAIVLGTAAAAGVAATHIRSDATIVAFDAPVPSTSAAADVASAGVAAVAARRDHLHGREGFGAVSAQLAFGAASANGAAVTHARSDHTHGTPTHLTADHSAVSISGLAVPTADVPWNTHKITGLLDPTASQDAATKNYVDNVAQGLSPKGSVVAATTA